MAKVFYEEEFKNFYDRNSGRIFQDLEFKKCQFISSSISITRNLKRRSILKNIKLTQCEEIGCSLDTAVVEDVIVDGLSTSDILQSWGAIYKHVVLKGNIGRIMISPLIATAMATPKEQAAFDITNANFYSTVDWALDITEARFSECDIRRIPARLIRRDPETQVVVTREKALLGDWKKLNLSKTYWAQWIELFLRDGDKDVVLVAPKRHPKFADWLDGLKMLREAGIAEQE